MFGTDSSPPVNAGDGGSGGDGATDDRLVVAFAMEQHLGHRTYCQNLRDHVDADDIAPVWIPIDYESEGLAEKMPASLAAAWSGRRAVRNGLARAGADAHVFNTQVPAVLGGSIVRSRPYVLVTDVTPIEYDRIAEGYGHRPDGSGPISRLKHHLNLRTMQGAAWCVGWSNRAAQSYIDDYGVPGARVRVIPPGVDLERWRPPTSDRRHDDGTFRILFVGGDFDRKGGRQLLRAFSTLPSSAELVVVTRADVPTTDRVRVVSHLNPNDAELVELYRTSHVFALPTLAETFGIAAAEAAASGLPVVASDVGGIPDIVLDDSSGCLVPAGDEAALAAALRRLHDAPDLRRSMGHAARRHAEEAFDAQTNADALLDLVRRAAGR